MKNLVKCAMAAAALAAATGAAAATKAAKWLVLDKISYAADVDARDFAGIASRIHRNRRLFMLKKWAL